MFGYKVTSHSCLHLGYNIIKKGSCLTWLNILNRKENNSLLFATQISILSFKKNFIINSNNLINTWCLHHRLAIYFQLQD